MSTVKMGRSDFMPPSPEKAKAKKRVSSTSPKKRRLKLSDFLFKGELGRGTYGSVFKALRRGKTKPYAIKVINMKGMTKKQLHDCSEEVRILSSLKNANIVKYLDSFVDAGKLYIVMEFVNGGDLALVLSGWGVCSGSCPADFDGNGMVNGGDLAQILAVWGPCSPGQ